MTTKDANPPSFSLADVRREIDAIDDAMVDLLAKRFQLVEYVKQVKSADGKSGETPLRPAREAQVLRRLAGRAQKLGLDPKLPVCLWPLIFSEASLMQADVQIHAPAELAGSGDMSGIIRRQFGNLPIVPAPTPHEAMMQIVMRPKDIAVVALQSNWIETFLGPKGDALSVIGLLDAGSTEEPNRLVVLGQLTAEPSGHDETLMVSKGSLPRDFPVRAVWSASNGPYTFSGVTGFLSEKENPLMGVIRSNRSLGLKVLGRYPQRIGV